MKKRTKWALALLAVYLLLAALLSAVERTGPEPSIRSFGDAIWYSLITMSTVGYGDLTPVTAVGRLIGLVFVLCSVGILSAMIGLCLRLIGGTLIPRLRLRLGRGRPWYVFFDDNEAAAVLAAALRREEPNCLLVFPAGSGGEDAESAVRLSLDADALLRLRKSREGLFLFFLGAEPWDNYARALPAAELGLDACCLGDIRLGETPEHLHIFSPGEALGRDYWNRFPLQREERCLVLLGDGEALSAVLERGLLNNVFPEQRGIEYHVFGDGGRFARRHPELVKALDGNGEDRLVFHDEDWTACRALLARADRIILCMDSDGADLAARDTLESWYVCPGRVHVRLSRTLPGLICFGDRAHILSPDYVMRRELDRRAMLMNDIYNEGAARPTPWRELSPFLRQSNIAAADHLPVKVRALLDDETLTGPGSGELARAWARYTELDAGEKDRLWETEHRRWLRFHQMYNWQYAPERSNALRRHPLLRPYAELSPEDKAKDAYAWEMLGKIG